ncbi:MAG: hypothetical protein K8R21_00160, partial [Leptospira sp.]|nr:hypothetical protein [Leptospira sp.]
MKSKISFIICLVLLSFVGGTFCSAGSEDTQKSGGKCNYKSYPGLFKVNEIVKTKIGQVSDSVEVTVK